MNDHMFPFMNEIHGILNLITSKIKVEITSRDFIRSVPLPCMDETYLRFLLATKSLKPSFRSVVCMCLPAKHNSHHFRLIFR